MLEWHYMNVLVCARGRDTIKPTRETLNRGGLGIRKGGQKIGRESL